MNHEPWRGRKFSVGGRWLVVVGVGSCRYYNSSCWSYIDFVTQRGVKGRRKFCVLSKCLQTIAGCYRHYKNKPTPCMELVRRVTRTKTKQASKYAQRGRRRNDNHKLKMRIVDDFPVFYSLLSFLFVEHQELSKKFPNCQVICFITYLVFQLN